jgi:hypothetical protein
MSDGHAAYFKRVRSPYFGGLVAHRHHCFRRGAACRNHGPHRARACAGNAAPLRRAGGLGSHETLVAFEDFSFGAQGWTGTADRISAARVPVFGPFDTGAIGKSFALPMDTARVRIGFDMHLPEAGDGFSVRVNGQSVIEGGLALASSNAVVDRRDQSGEYTVWILLDRPGDAGRRWRWRPRPA